LFFAFFLWFFHGSPVRTGSRTRTKQAEPVLSGSVPVPVLFWPKTIGSVLGSSQKVKEPDWTKLRQHYHWTPLSEPWVSLHLELATMRRNVRRQRNSVGWDGAFTGRNVRWNGTSPTTPRWWITTYRVASSSADLNAIEHLLLRHSFYFHFYFEHLNSTRPYLIDMKISWSLDLFDLISTILSWRSYHLMMIQDMFLYINFTLLLTCIRHAFDSCLSLTINMHSTHVAVQHAFTICLTCFEHTLYMCLPWGQHMDISI